MPDKAATPADKKRSSLLFWLGCASVFLILLLVAVGITMMLMLRRTTGQAGATRQRPPLQADWRAASRTAGALPPEAALAPARTDTGNAAAVLHAVPLPQPYRAAYTRLSRRMTTDTAERAAVAALLRDTTVDRVAAAARIARFDAVPLIIGDTASAMRLFGVPMPMFFMWSPSFRAVEMLLARGVARERAGRTEQARSDYRAAIGLGLMMFAREPSVAGSAQGLRFVADGATSLHAVADRRDTATANAADRLAAWAGRTRADEFRIIVALSSEPDSLLSAATDTTLPFPLRAEAVHSGAVQFLVNGPWAVFRGPTGATFTALRQVERDRDSGLAQLALAYDSTLARLDRTGRWARLQWYLHGRR